MVAGCETASPQNSGAARILTSAEMDRITAGVATATSEATALATGGAPRTAASATTQTNSGNSLIPGSSFRNYATTRATALASNGQRIQAGVSTQISVDGGSGGAWIDAAGTVAGGGTGPVQVSTQAYGISTARTDLAFGSVSASACCGSTATVQVKADSGAGGSYSQEIHTTATSDVQGQAQRKVDIAIVSSALPVLDPARLLVTGGSARISPKY